MAFSGRDPRKRVDLALEAVLALGPDAPRLRVLAAAGLPSGFEERAAAAIAAGRVELLGRVPRDQLWSVLSGASALVYPSVAEGFGLPVLEAMAVGVPVVTGSRRRRPNWATVLCSPSTARTRSGRSRPRCGA